MRKKIFWLGFLGFFGLLSLAAAREEQRAVDMRVEKFLAKMKGKWHDLNVPEADGKVLHDIIVQKRYRKALEVGTSTGHSALWIAWALSKTGGKLITIEIDEKRHRQALANFREAGLSDFVDARLGDAHRLVEELPGPFDFVFVDADKDYYPAYARVLAPKVQPGGCLTAHNVEEPGPVRQGGYEGGTEEYFRYMKSLPEFDTFIHPRSRWGVAVSFKRM